MGANVLVCPCVDLDEKINLSQAELGSENLLDSHHTQINYLLSPQNGITGATDR